MAVYRDGIGVLRRFTATIPRPMRTWLLVLGAFIVLLTVLQHQSPRAIRHAASYASEQWYGGLPGQFWDRKGQKAAFFKSKTNVPTQWGSEDAKPFWNEYAKVLIDGKPSFDKIAFRDDFKPRWFPPTFKSTEPITGRIQDLNMTDEQVEELTYKHKKAVDTVKELAKGLPYRPGTRGIVFSTEMEVMPFLSVSIRMLRRTGTTLPVEVWIYDRSNWGIEPYGLQICQQVFEPLDATCHFVTDYLPSIRPAPWDKQTEKYQNKLDALMFSSFEQVVLIDSDNIPIMPLDDIFTQQPFTSHGLIIWPDYWRDMASPSYYKIAGVEEESPFKRAATESGQVFLNKATHGAALLLTRFYNLYHFHWVRLFSQDPTDEGDKETYRNAARALGLPFYQVAEPPERVGYRCSDKQHPMGSGQHHPVDDFFLSSLSIRRENTDDTIQDGLTPRTLFIHSNLPKLDPAIYPIWRDPEFWPDLQYCNGVAHRIWGPRSLTMLKYGWDVEKALWDQMRWVACNTESIQMHWFHPNPRISNATFSDVCEHFIKLHDELLTADGGASQGLVYQSTLTPAPYDVDGEFSMSWQKQKATWAGTTWRWHIAANALAQKDTS